MIELQKILIPTDFSETAEEAATYAAALAEAFAADVHLLHVAQDVSVHLPEFGMGISLVSFKSSKAHRQQELEEAAQKRLNNFALTGCEQSELITAVRHGKPFVEIVRYAREFDVDLVVMGTHGHGLVAHTLLGSVAEKVVQKSPCPVLTVRPDGHQFVLP